MQALISWVCVVRIGISQFVPVGRLDALASTIGSVFGRLSRLVFFEFCNRKQFDVFIFIGADCILISEFRLAKS